MSESAEVVARLVHRYGGRFSREMGIDVDAGGDQVARWLLAATLFGTRISTTIAVRTYRVMADHGVRTLADVPGRSWDELVALLDRGGYTRYDHRTATRLHKLATTLHGQDVGALRTGDLERTRAALRALPGWGPVTVSLFLRELRGVWPGIDPPLDERSLAAADHLGLLEPHEQALHSLRAIASGAGLELRDTEAALIRLWLAHHREFDRCVGGPGCAAASDPSEALTRAPGLAEIDGSTGQTAPDSHAPSTTGPGAPAHALPDTGKPSAPASDVSPSRTPLPTRPARRRLKPG